MSVWPQPISHPPIEVIANAPRLTEARCELMREIQVCDEYGDRRTLQIPAERPLTVYVDKRELVTLMTLGVRPEWLVLGYLCNQRLVDQVSDVESITVDWDVGAAAVKTRTGVVDFDRKTAQRVVTTGCGQGTVFGEWLSEVDAVRLPDAQQARISQTVLYRMLDTIRQHDSIHGREHLHSYHCRNHPSRFLPHHEECYRRIYLCIRPLYLL